MADNYEYTKCILLPFPPAIVYVSDGETKKPVFVNDGGVKKVVFVQRYNKTTYEYEKCSLTAPSTKTRYEYEKCSL